MFLDFFRKPPFGLDISDYSIEIISLVGSIKKPRLLAMGRSILEPGVVSDGKILNKEILKKSLKDLIEKPKFGKIKTKKLIFALPGSKSFIHIFDLPKNLKKDEKNEFIKSQASQTFPFPLTDIYLDFQIQNNEVLLIAAPKKIVNDYLEVFKDCQLQLVALEIESESLSRALIGDTKEPVLITDVGARTTNFNVFDQGKLRLSISNEIAGNKFTASLAEGLKISKPEAEKTKREAGLNPEIEEGRIFFILQRDVQMGMILEIRKIESYFQKKEGKKIEKIILTGGSSLLPRLQEYLAENLGKEVVMGDPWLKINIDILKEKEYFKEALEVNPILYSTVIGSTLRGLAKNPKKAGINLIRGI